MDALKTLIEQIKADPSTVTDEQITAATAGLAVSADSTDADLVSAREAIQDAVAELRAATPNRTSVKLLQGIAAAKTAVDAEQATREAATAEVNAEAERLLGELGTPAAEASTDGEQDGDASVPADGEVAAETPELVSVAASLAAAAKSLAAFAPGATPAKAEPAPVEGRTARRITTGNPILPNSGEVAKATVYAGASVDEAAKITDSFGLAKAIHDIFRTRYQAANFAGRMPVAHIKTEYPESRKLGQNLGENFAKMEAATSPTALVAAGGLCAPLETLYDVEVIGSAARPVRDALARFAVDRGGIQYRPNTSAAAAVHGAGLWTVDDDAAGTGTKACYQVECPGMEDEVIEAIYLCLEYSNITTRFDPETTASNVQQGMIAHARFAENRLLSKLAAGSKLLTAPRVIGATRDILVNLDKTVAYYKNRHRIDDALPLTWMAPGWVKSLMRADLARQMAAGDWMEALAPADAAINSWFSARGVTPVWHLDGPSGVDEVQTITITGTPTGGTFTLTYDGQTTSAIAYNATAADVKTALAALSNVHAEDITTAGGGLPGTPVTVTFGGGEFDGSNVPQMTATGSLTGGSTPAVAVTTTTGGGGAITVQGVTVASQTYGNAAAAGTIPGFPGQIDSLLFTPGSWLFLDGGSLDLGLVRDSTLNAKNRYRQFSETFEGAAFRGIESLRLVMSVEPTGQTSGTADLSSIAD
jgi:hypothetical protein